MRVCVLNETGEYLEMQSHATPGTLIRNAVALGYRHDEVHEVEMTAEQFEVTRPKPPELTPEQKLARAGLSIDELKTMLGLP